MEILSGEETEGNAPNKSLDMSYIDIQQKLNNRDIMAEKPSVGLNTRRSDWRNKMSKTVLLPATSNDGPDQYNLIMRAHSEHSDEYFEARP